MARSHKQKEDQAADVEPSRPIPSGKQGEQMETRGSLGNIEDGKLPTSENDGVVKGSAVAKTEKAAPPEGPKRRMFRVVRGGMILDRGYRTRLHEGKEIDDLNYDIRRLQQQGIALQEITEEDRTRSVGSSY